MSMETEMEDEEAAKFHANGDFRPFLERMQAPDGCMNVTCIPTNFFFFFQLGYKYHEHEF